jgi:hypothetical protein
LLAAVADAATGRVVSRFVPMREAAWIQAPTVTKVAQTRTASQSRPPRQAAPSSLDLAKVVTSAGNTCLPVYARLHDLSRGCPSSGILGLTPAVPETDPQKNDAISRHPRARPCDVQFRVFSAKDGRGCR